VCDAVPEGNAYASTDAQGRWHACNEVLGRCVVCHSPWYEEPDRSSHIPQKSMHQKINTKSSTESELVGVSDALPQIIWTSYFLEAQGYDIKDLVVFQDNQSTILLEQNGKASSRKQMRHINIRYFFIKDWIDSGDKRVTYCPTEVWWLMSSLNPFKGLHSYDAKAFF